MSANAGAVSARSGAQGFRQHRGRLHQSPGWLVGLASRCPSFRRSGSMEPAFYKGDILFLNNDPPPIEVGEIVVFKIEGKDVPIVHRIVESNFLANGTEAYLTKGDNNPMDDRQGMLYAEGQVWLQRRHMLGRAVGALPFVGHVTILLNEYPAAKVILVGLMGLLVISSKEG